MFAPFDGRSELVTVGNTEDLITAFDDFLHERPRFDAFLSKSAMEKYVGFIDGGNLDRNLDYIYGKLGIPRTGAGI